MAFELDICQVEDIVKKKYKVTPVSIEPWFDTVNVNANAVSSQNLTYTWRYNGKLDLNPATASKEFPFYVGYIRFTPYNSDPVTNTIANSFVEIAKYDVLSIGTFYNTDAKRLIRYGIGTFNGETFPLAGQKEVNNFLDNPHFTTGPFSTVQVFTDAAGAVYLQVQFTFVGFRVFIA